MEDNIVCRSDRWEDAELEDLMETIAMIPWFDREVGEVMDESK